MKQSVKHNPISNRELVPQDWEQYKFYVAQLCATEFNRQKQFYYALERIYYTKVRASEKDRVAFWKEVLGNRYPTLMRYIKAIHAWKRVDYPYAIPIRYLMLTEGLSVQDKQRFVEFWNENHTSEELEEWIRSQKKLPTKELYGYSYIKQVVPEEVIEQLVARSKAQGFLSLLEWKT